MHRLWSNFESGVGCIMRVKRARGRIAPEEGEVGGGATYLAWVKLPALVLGVLLAVCCYFGNLGNALLCVCVRVITFHYKLEALVQNDAPPFSPLGPKRGEHAPPSLPGSKTYGMVALKNLKF